MEITGYNKQGAIMKTISELPRTEAEALAQRLNDAGI
jgi:hypothetical protein